jgi:hypothetical protein
MPSSLSARIWTLSWRAILIALAYVLGLVVAGALAAALGWHLPARSDATLLWTAVGGVCIGLTLALVVWRTSWSAWSRFVIGTCAVFFTMLSITIEGALFAPTLIGSLPALVLVDLLAAVAVGGVAMLGSAPTVAGATRGFSWRMRPWYSWGWRFALSAGSYVLFYWIYGALNYMLVTQRYYTALDTQLQVPSPQLVLVAEAVRGPLLVLAVLPLALTPRLTRRRLVFSGAAVLVIVGGIVPLLHQAGTLPIFLLVASGWEIALQNLSLALVISWLLGRKALAEAGPMAQAASAQETAPSGAR